MWNVRWERDKAPEKPLPLHNRTWVFRPAQHVWREVTDELLRLTVEDVLEGRVVDSSAESCLESSANSANSSLATPPRQPIAASASTEVIPDTPDKMKGKRRRLAGQKRAHRLQSSLQSIPETPEEEEKAAKRSRSLRAAEITAAEEVLAWPLWYSALPASAKTRQAAEVPVDGSLNQRIFIYEGDATLLKVDALVNAANSRLRGGGGIDGAIRKAAGPKLTEETKSLRGCPVGEARSTGGYNLPARWVVHAVGPRGEKPDLLATAYASALAEAARLGAASVGLPCISAGIFGYPAEAAADVAARSIRDFLAEHGQPSAIVLCLHTSRDRKAYAEALPKYFPLPSSRSP